MSNPLGIIARIMIFGVGTLVALGLLWLSTFAATFKKTPAEWDTEAVTILILGIMAFLAGLGAAFRPSRLTWLSVVVVAVAIPVVGLIL